MKKAKYFLFSIGAITVLSAFMSHPSFSQSAPPPVSSMYNVVINKQFDIVGDSRYWLRTDVTYTVGGAEISGTPFLYMEWNKGIVKTPDGRVFSDLEIKYDAYNQELHYKNGLQSIIVSEPVSEFTFTAKEGKEEDTFLFRQASLYSNKLSDKFLEVLYEDDYGALLKANKKVVYSATENLLDVPRKYFQLELTYFYFNKAKKKMVKLKNDGSNLEEATGIKDLNTGGKNWGEETNLIELIKSAHKKTQKPA